MRERGFTLVELLAATAVLLVLSAVVAGAGWKVIESSSLAVSANNIRQLAAGGASYLGEHNNVYWPWCQYDFSTRDTIWWFGKETAASRFSSPEGQRDFDPSAGPLGEYVPKGVRPDPSLTFGGKALKPKFRNGYVGAGYNTLLGGGWYWDGKDASKLQHALQLADPSKVVVFFSSAQVNTFQAPATSKNPMIEEFYGVDARECTIHFRHGGKAMVSFATGNVGFLEMDPSTLDKRMPGANIGRFAPSGSTLYLH